MSVNFDPGDCRPVSPQSLIHLQLHDLVFLIVMFLIE